MSRSSPNMGSSMKNSMLTAIASASSAVIAAPGTGTAVSMAERISVISARTESVSA
jgi:hypothetical protein